MARYIDAVKAADVISQRVNIPLDDLVDVFAEIPTADVVEVKHGYWMDNIQKFTSLAGVTKDCLVGYKCSARGRTEGRKEPFCNCGAKMDSQL